MKSRKSVQRLAILFSLLSIELGALGQANLPVYTDRLVNGFQDWSWAARNLATNNPVHSGSNSIEVVAGAYAALALHSSAPIPVALFSNVTFWIHGGASGGQSLQVRATVNQVQQQAVSIAKPVANTWQQRTVSLAALGLSGKTNFDGLWIQNASGSSAGAFYVDDIALAAKPAPNLVQVSVNATQSIRSVDSRWFGINAAVWDSNFSKAETTALLREMGTAILRFPGGSLSDEYHWAANRTGTNTWQWATSFDKFATVATNLGAQAFITVNYGSGTATEAADWVRYSNLTRRYGFKYWEIGNENYGTWETDTNSNAHDAYTYAVRAKDYFQQMKAVDPAIKVGIVVTPGEDASDNGYRSHPATNTLTGTVHYGWTPVVLSTLRALGITPDFLVHHRYPQWSSADSANSADSDLLLLQSSSAWGQEAANLRYMVNAYFGSGGAQIELVSDENNSNSGAQGRQSTSLVNGLYYADSLGQLMQTEFNAFVWWDLRNGSDTHGSFDSTVYGWRSYGDLGIINGLTTRHPPFYAAKLMRAFGGAAANIVPAVSDYALLSAYAARGGDGSLNVLVVNKDTSSTFNARLQLDGFNPKPTAQIVSYGIAQDEAARTNAPLTIQDLVTTSFATPGPVFTNSFAPLSLTLLQFSPAAVVAPRLSLVSLQNGSAVLELEGSPGMSYVVQHSSDLTTWMSVSTNALGSASAITLTNATGNESRQYWRAVSLP